MNYQKEKRPVDKEAINAYGFLERSFVFIRKTRIKTWKALSVVTFFAGMVSYLILSFNADVHLTTKAVGETASLSLSPSVANVALGDIFEVDVRLNTNGNDVVVTRAIVNYNPSNFSLVGWNTNSSVFASDNICIYNDKPCEIVNNDTVNGIIDITLAKPSPGVNISSGLIATLTFQALQTTSDNITLNFTNGSYSDSDVILDGIGDDGAGTDILNSVGNSSVTVYVPCVEFLYSEWLACQSDNTQVRTIVSSLPEGCSGGNPILSQDCVYSATCTGFTYDDWGLCQPNGIQTRNIVDSFPENCVGGSPIIAQICPVVCGDGYCAGSVNGEDCSLCPDDCVSSQQGTCEVCWKGVCDGNCNKSKETSDCEDCVEDYCCGDGVCEALENTNNCYIDCKCSSDENCGDDNSCTTDTCDIDSGMCENIWPACGINDDCCGPQCALSTDADCQNFIENCANCLKGICDGICHPVKESLNCPDC